MPYHQSCLKRIRSSKKRNERNRSARSRLRNTINGVLTAKDKTAAAAALVSAYSVIDKSLKAGIIRDNNAANKKARLSKFVNKLQG